MSNPPTVKFGILGCADIARKLSRAILLSPHSTLHCIGSRSIEKAHRYARSNGFPSSTKIYGSYDDVIADADVDAVYIPLPTSMHREWAVRAAEKGKHVLLEKPTALSVGDLDVILNACDVSGVQFMDGTMWMHHPRTKAMEEFLRDQQRFGQLVAVQTTFTIPGDTEFLEKNIRVQPHLDALGALGDVGWYCIRASLWASNYNLPKSVTALNNPIKNKAGVLLSCGASLHWEDGKVSTFFCSFLANLTMDITAIGSKGTLQINDFVVPYKEKVAGYMTVSDARFTDRDLEWNKEASEHRVESEVPQEVMMVEEMARFVDGVRKGAGPEKKWPSVTRKTQVVMDAVRESIERGFVSVEVVY